MLSFIINVSLIHDKFISRGKGKGPAVVVIPDEPPEKFLCGCNAVSVVSQALCQAASLLKDVPLYQHVTQLRSDQVRCLSKCGTNWEPILFSSYEI